MKKRVCRKEKIVWGLLAGVAFLLYALTDVSYAGWFIGSVLLYGGIACMLAYACGRQLEWNITGDGQGVKNEEMEVTVWIKNRSILPVVAGQISIVVKNRLTSEQTIVLREFSVYGRKKTPIRFLLQSAFCGCVEILITEAEISDPLRLCVRKQIQEKKMCCYLFPRMQELPFSEDELEQYDAESYRYAMSKKGNDNSETFGIRSYVEGDSLKAVHWKLTGKMDELLVRECSLPVESSLMMLLDKRLCPGEQMNAQEKDRLTEVFLSLSYTAVMRGIPHTVGWYYYGESRFEQYEIRQEADLYQMLQPLLCGAHQEDEMTTVEHLIEAGAEQRDVVYLYVTDSAYAERDTERLREYGNVKIYRTKKQK